MTSSGEAFGRLLRLARKELSEILRDRRTMITLFLMPLLLYPLLSIAFQQFYVLSKHDPARAEHRIIGFLSKRDQAAILPALKAGLDELSQEVLPELRWPDQPLGDAKTAEKALREGAVDLVIRVAAVGKPGPKSNVLELEIQFVPQSVTSISALHLVERLLAATNGATLARLAQAKLPVPVRYIRSERARIEVTTDSTQSLTALVPLILILMTITGAVYPAIDLTAGERERGTLEILVAAPVPRLGLLFAKYLTVMTVAMLTAVVNLVTMIVTLTLSGLGKTPALEGVFTAGTILQLLFLLLLFALFFSAVLLCLTSFARSFKEAQAYLIPLMLASLGPGCLGLIPELKLEGFMTVAPLVNVVILGRDLLQGQAALLPAVLVVSSTLIYAVAAIALAARVFGAESVLYSEQSSWGDLFRRPREVSDVAAPAAALWCLMLTIPVHFVLKGLFLQMAPPPEIRFALVAAISVLLFVGLPVIFVWLGRVRWGPAFGWAAARPAALAGALLLGAALWPVVLWLLSQVHIAPPEAVRESLQQELAMLSQARKDMPLLVLFSVVVPALVEELFFRGFLFGAVRRVCGGWTTIVGTALAFGLLHVVMGGALGLNQFLPSTLMGLILGWVRCSSGSVIPGMILHAVHNGLLMVAAPLLLEQRQVAEQSAHVPVEWVLAGLGGTALGLWLVWWGRRRTAVGVSVEA